MATLSAKGIRINTAKLKEDIAQIPANAAAEATQAVKEELESLIRKLNRNSSMREDQAIQLGIGSRLPNDMINMPFRNAKVVVNLRKRAKYLHAIVYVEHSNIKGVNLFDLLNDGSGPRRGPFTFPLYYGTLTSPGKLSTNRGGAQLTGKMTTVKRVDGFEGRKFYEKIANRVQRKQNTVETGKTSEKVIFSGEFGEKNFKFVNFKVKHKKPLIRVSVGNRGKGGRNNVQTRMKGF